MKTKLKQIIQEALITRRDLKAAYDRSLPEYLYHGTSSEKLRFIKRVGLQAPVFLGSEKIAQWKAGEETDLDGSDPVILKIKLSDLEGRFLRPDAVLLEEPPPDNVLGMSEEFVWKAWDQSKQNWRDSYRIVQSVKYMLDVPPEDCNLPADDDGDEVFDEE